MANPRRSAPPSHPRQMCANVSERAHVSNPRAKQGTCVVTQRDTTAPRSAHSCQNGLAKCRDGHGLRQEVKEAGEILG
jgi:hypothetical protein